VLQEFVDVLRNLRGKTFKTTLLSVSTISGSGGSVTNIPFEVGNADVSGYEMELWIIEVFDSPTAISPSATFLQYLQKIPMTFYITQSPIPGGTGYDGVQETFYHITANSLTKVPGT